MEIREGAILFVNESRNEFIVYSETELQQAIEKHLNYHDRGILDKYYLISSEGQLVAFNTLFYRSDFPEWKD